VIDVTRLSRLFEGRTESIRDARAFARAFIAERVPDDLVETAELVVSELCTNAVEHTASGDTGGHFILELEIHTGRVRVSVVDLGAQTRPAVNDAQADDDAESGRGLLIVDAVSKEWGTELAGVGSRVWADVVGSSV
jgi:anti-sigma regulatory factor (Ser/Thr protein kinase)